MESCVDELSTWGYGEENVVLLTEAGGQDGVRGSVVTEVVGVVGRLRSVDTNHQVTVQ